jgi:hypothetical protein
VVVHLEIVCFISPPALPMIPLRKGPHTRSGERYTLVQVSTDDGVKWIVAPEVVLDFYIPGISTSQSTGQLLHFLQPILVIDQTTGDLSPLKIRVTRHRSKTNHSRKIASTENQ